MPKHIDMMREREKRIFSLLEFISKKTQGFSNPKLITIGGYALRAYVPFSRYTRDCDFVMKKETDWGIDTLKTLLSKKIITETFEKKERFGFLRMVDFIQSGRNKIKISLDIMEGEVRGRINEQIVLIDEKFIRESKMTRISIAGKDVEIFVPDYRDYIILKVVSGRPSDIRDIAALIWKNGVPENIKTRLKEILPHPDIFVKNLNEMVVPTISDGRFVNSWRGTFISTQFSEESRNDVLKKVTNLKI